MKLTRQQILDRDYSLDLDNVYEARLAPAIEMVRIQLADNLKWFTYENLSIEEIIDEAFRGPLQHMKNKEQVYHVLHYLCKPLEHNCDYNKRVADEVIRVRENNITHIINLAYLYHAHRIVHRVLLNHDLKPHNDYCFS